MIHHQKIKSEKFRKSCLKHCFLKFPCKRKLHEQVLKIEISNVFEKHWKVSVQTSRTVTILVKKVVSQHQNLVVKHCFPKMCFSFSGMTSVFLWQEWTKKITFSKKDIVLVDFASFIEAWKLFNLSKTADFWTFRAPIPENSRFENPQEWWGGGHLN